tara:strand:+ start:71 stop:292 length:222 start_codon:yes stop_codon:yes gene_type:complete
VILNINIKDMTVYTFFIRYNDGRVKTYNKVCYKPKMTKHYKYIMNLLDNDNDDLIEHVGYATASEFSMHHPDY